MYRCKHFAIHELVPPQVYEERGELAWELLDDRMLKAADNCRARFGKMTINNYFWGGKREWSGLRTPDSPFYSKYSQHTFGRAFDAIFANVSSEHVRKEILTHPQLFPYLNSIELNVSWLHGDTRNCERIKTYSP